MYNTLQRVYNNTIQKIVTGFFSVVSPLYIFPKKVIVAEPSQQNKLCVIVFFFYFFLF
jgi:hypothetical protein